MSAAAAIPESMRRSNLAWAYQDVMTVVLRVRFRTQRVADAEAFRDSVRKMIAAATADARRAEGGKFIHATCAMDDPDAAAAKLAQDGGVRFR